MARIGVRIPEQIKREGMKKAIDLDLDFGEYIAQLIEKDTKENRPLRGRRADHED